ncbi:MAG: hypothetical protein ACLQLH_16165 [Terracidiphilus sp.]|jgi:hypothetical protein
MWGPRTWNRREFDVAPNGYFTILKATGWFSAVRLPGGFRYLVRLPKWTAPQQAQENSTENPTAAPSPESTFEPVQKAPGHADSQETAILSQSMIPGPQDHKLMRLVLIVLAATAVTSIVLWWLWWIGHPLMAADKWIFN